ncbi:hypothetical protein BST63_02875 [Bradyrhizobium canariense]|uniref:Uncharacterized protein n=1 Tax=Bradyrhizobium canariense TaxID=255045 RepID=A0ABX3XAA5_9BRAD|nr:MULTISPECIES: hypothetical protein [Bradyrhizobium]OSJ34824.1 hypothetical protein BST63_02875 [Bradyrhizobium canariense]WOH61875.1 hypothetical protein RX329_17985 [Bradyrhizobium sp. BWC-3-1]
MTSAALSKPTKRQLALIAWTISNPPPGATNGELIMLGQKMTHLLTASEQEQVAEFVRDKQAMLKALKRRASKPWR